MKPPSYCWVMDGNQLVLHENNTAIPYDRPSLEEALRAIRAADRPTHKCGYQFERNRALTIAKYQAGLDLVTRSGETK